jgi:biotin-independent malonate decarboxylase beta subunit
VTTNSFAALDPRARIDALFDADSFVESNARAASPYLATWSIAAQDNDGVVTGTGTLVGQPFAIAAQDVRFLGGSVGASHGDKLASLFEHALARRTALALLLESGGVRLHEANAAELALARALRALLSLRVAGIPTIAVIAGPCFGGASVLACACESVCMLPAASLGLSGPKVIELARGQSEIDASDRAAIAAIYGAAARSRSGFVEALPDEPAAIRAKLSAASKHSVAMTVPLLRTRLQNLGARAALPPQVVIGAPVEPKWLGEVESVTSSDWLWQLKGRNLFVLPPAGLLPVGPEFLLATSAAVLDFVERNATPATLFIFEDSPGHELSRRAEILCLSQFLALHAETLALAMARGHRVLGLLIGTGHSAAFFANALQTDALYALRSARVVAMEQPAIGRVTGLPLDKLAALIENDRLLGQPVRHLAALGGIAGIWEEANADALVEAARSPR